MAAQRARMRRVGAERGEALMTLHSSLSAPTKAQQRRHDAIKEAGCVPCHIEGIGYSWPEINHIVECGKRKGHSETYGCCPWHHRGIIPYGSTRRRMTELFGPSLAYGSKPFHSHFGGPQELLAKQNEMLGFRTAA